MPFSFYCPGCGKKYQVDEQMAGRQATCRCGTSAQIPAVVGEEDAGSLEDWIADAFRPAVHSRPAPEPEPETTPESEPQTSPPEPDPDQPTRQRRRKRKFSRWRKQVAVASIAYGTIAAVVLLVLMVMMYPFGILFWGADFILAVALGVSGVLLLRRHRKGPACTGLSAMFLCFFGAWTVFWNMVGALTVGNLVEALALVAFLLITYTIPAGIVWWSLREELKIQDFEAEEQERRVD